jgi:hypothetical protein
VAEQGEAEWRAALLANLVKYKALTPAEAEIVVQREAYYRPWECPVTRRPKNLEKFGR